MNISSFCIKHRVTTILSFVLIALYGFTMYFDLKLTLIPEIKYPGAMVYCIYNGAGPEEIEELLTRPLESAIATVSGVKEIHSTASEGVTTLNITYTEDTDVDEAANKLREKFGQLTLPEGCEDPMIYNLNLNDYIPVMVIALMGEDLGELQTIADKKVSPALERIKGVGRVEIAGGIKSKIVVATDAARMAGYSISIDYLSQYLKGTNILIPGGDVENGVNSLTVATDGRFSSIGDVANTLIPLPTGGSVRLSEVAKVYMEEERQQNSAKSNGKDCVILSIMKQSDANDVETAKDIKAVLASLKEEYPSLDYVEVHDSSKFILSTANSAVGNIVMGVLLAAGVVFLFLRRFGATAAIAVSMPFCILTVFAIMQGLDITLNMISLGGIALGVGMIVDNSIVVLENIYRHAANGSSRYDACVMGTKEVSLPVTASTFTTVAVFLPLGLASGLAGMLFRDFCLTITALLLSSLIIALTLVPLMCYFLLDEKKVQQRKREQVQKETPFADKIEKLRQWYLKALSWLIRKRRYGMLISLGLVVLFLVSCIKTNMIFMPDVDQGQLTISITMPTGTEDKETARTADRVVGIMEKTVPELVSNFYFTESGKATVGATLVSLQERDRSSKEVALALGDAMKDIAGCEIEVTATSMTQMTANTSDIQVEIRGEDYRVLEEIAGDLKQKISRLPNAVNVKSSVDKATPTVKVKVNRESSAMYGLTAAAIGGAVRAELTGVTATSMTMNGKEIDVMIQGNEVAAASLDALRSMPLTTGTGAQVPLSAVADVMVELAPQTINRVDQSRQVNVVGDMAGEDLTGMTQRINEIIDSYEMPEGYTATTGGSQEEMTDNFKKLFLALAIALGLVYFILASQFESFLLPLMIMMIMPVAISGALFGLPVTGQELSIIAIVGLIMLSGVVVNNSIILVDYIKVRRERGGTKEEAILEACPLRIRPILMTTLTTILAMLPMGMGIGDGAELMQPLAVVTISGMIISTIVTLFFTPVYYSVLDSLAEKASRFVHRKRAATKAGEVEPLP